MTVIVLIADLPRICHRLRRRRRWWAIISERRLERRVVVVQEDCERIADAKRDLEYIVLVRSESGNPLGVSGGGGIFARQSISIDRRGGETDRSRFAIEIRHGLQDEARTETV